MTALPTPERIMELALTTTPSEASVVTPSPAARKKCDVLLLISSAAAAGYERRRRAVRRTYLTALREQQLQGTVEYRFLLGEPPTAEEVAVLDTEQAESIRITAIRLLGCRPFVASRDTLSKLIDTRQPEPHLYTRTLS